MKFTDTNTAKTYEIDGLNVTQRNAEGVVVGSTKFEDGAALVGWLDMMGFKRDMGLNAPLKTLYTAQDCYDCIEAIEKDWHSVEGGLKAWYSGYNTEFTPKAKAKIASIRRKLAKMDRTSEDDDC